MKIKYLQNIILTERKFVLIKIKIHKNWRGSNIFSFFGFFSVKTQKFEKLSFESLSTIILPDRHLICLDR